jgi:hypothetical protein
MDDMTSLINDFCQIRDYVEQNIATSIECFMTDIWDPLMKHIIIKETQDIYKRDIIREFPDFPIEYIPRIRFKIYESEHDIEVGLQNYINEERGLMFLGTNEIQSVAYDYYVRDSWDPKFKYVFIARYGHSYDCIFKGSKTAEAEYLLGAVTPLSVAYGMAIEDGFIT